MTSRVLISASIVLAAAMLLAPQQAHAGAPTCHTHSSGPYCRYTGTVRQVYVNSGNTILMYFDTSMDLAEPANVGISGVTSAAAGIVRADTNVEFARFFYSSILAAQARGATVHVQMRGVVSGYLVIDRIWVHE